MNDERPASDSEHDIPDGCRLDRVLKLIAREWTLHILWNLSRNGPMRFGRLQRSIEGISSKMLTDRLRMLEREGVVFREHEPTIPPKVTYGLTPHGHALDGALQAIEHIADHWPG